MACSYMQLLLKSKTSVEWRSLSRECVDCAVGAAWLRSLRSCGQQLALDKTAVRVSEVCMDQIARHISRRCFVGF